MFSLCAPVMTHWVMARVVRAILGDAREHVAPILFRTVPRKLRVKRNCPARTLEARR